MSELTPSQTVGPFYAYGLTPKGRAKWDPNGQYSWKETVGDNLITPDVVGDRIRIDIPARSIVVQVDEAELEQRRRTCSFKPAAPRPRVVSAALKAYAKLTTSADRGAVRDLSKLD